MDYKAYLGLVTLAIAVVSYGLYFRNIFIGKTKPHAVSWLIWSALNSAIFLTQVDNGAGAGSWVTGLSAIVAFSVFILAINRGEKNITKLDWYCVAGAMVALSFWYLGDQDVWSIIFASATFVVGFIPTIRKSINKPRQETALTYGLNGIKFLLAIYALNSLNARTVIYPATIVIMNFGFVGLLLFRRLKI